MSEPVSDHVWTREHSAAYLAGGLEGAEAERLEAHIAECADCTASLAAATHFDRALGTLFAPVRPKPGLEDRAIQALRVAPRPHTILLVGWVRRVTFAAAAIVVVITFGALISSVGRLPLPGVDKSFAFVGSSNSPPASEASRQFDTWAETEGGRRSHKLNDSGLDSNLADAIPELDRLAEETVKVIVTADPIGVPNSKEGFDTGSRFSFPVAPGNAEPRSRTEGGESTSAGRSGTVKGRVMQTEAGTAAGYRPAQPGGTGFAGGFAGGGGGTAPGMADGSVRGMHGPPPVATSGLMPSTTYTPSPGGKPAGPTATTGPSYFVPGSYKSTEGLAAQPGKDDSGVKGDKTSSPKPNAEPRDAKPANGDAKPDAGDPKGGSIQPAGTTAQPPPAAPEANRRIIIRSGDIEFEIESFDSAHAAVTKLVLGLKGAFVATVNSAKLNNGKVKGSITVRVPPELLDGLVLDLRKELGKGGELKGVTITSADVTKQYTDLESELRGARAMETRLLAMIKDGKGEIKQLLEAERELGNWRGKIEKAEGEIRYYSNLAALSTLTITLVEKEIRAVAAVTESEKVQAGVEVEDVDKAYQDLLKAVVEAKGRVTKSEVRQLSAGQYNATLNFEVLPDASGPIRDRLRQLGRVARLEIGRDQAAEGAVVPKDAKIIRGNTRFEVQLYNLANIEPRETASVSVAVADVANAYNSLRDAVAKSSGRVQNAVLNEQDKQNVTANIDFDVKRADEGAIRAALAAAGETTSRNVTRAPESDNVTDTKIRYTLTIFASARLRPRDTAVVQVAVADVSTSYQSVRETLAATKARIVSSQLDETDRQNVTAKLSFEVGRAEETAIRTSLEASGEVVSRQVTRADEAVGLTDARVLYSLSLLQANKLAPRESTTLGLEVDDVDRTIGVFSTQVAEVKGRQLDSTSAKERNGKATARLVYEVPLAAAPGLVEKFKSTGVVRSHQSVRDPQAPEGKTATARIEVKLGTTDRIIATEDGIWPPVKKGLSYSASVLLTSMTWLVFGLCVVLPWAVIGYGGYRVVRRLSRPAPTAEIAPPTTPTPPAPAA